MSQMQKLAKSHTKMQKHWTFQLNFIQSVLYTAWSLFHQCLLRFTLHETQGTRRLHTSSRRIQQRFICTPLYRKLIYHLWYRNNFNITDGSAERNDRRNASPGGHRESPGISDGKCNQLIKKLHSAWVYELLLQILFRRTSSSVMFFCVYTMSYSIRWVQF